MLYLPWILVTMLRNSIMCCCILLPRHAKIWLLRLTLLLMTMLLAMPR